jgi:TatD DNase family protein
LTLAQANQTLLISVAVDRRSSRETVETASSVPELVKAFVGVHPSEAAKEADLTWLGSALDSATGVGEIGLDPKYSETGPRSPQRRAFEVQLEKAEIARKPVLVHTRGAEREEMEVLSDYGPSSVLLHWFEGEGLLGSASNRGYFVSFGPALVYSRKLRRMARAVDRRLVVTETDGPIAFGPLRGSRGPSLIPSVVFALAETWGVGFDEARETVLENAIRFLGLAGKG